MVVQLRFRGATSVVLLSTMSLRGRPVASKTKKGQVQEVDRKDRGRNQRANPWSDVPTSTVPGGNGGTTVDQAGSAGARSSQPKSSVNLLKVIGGTVDQAGNPGAGALQQSSSVDLPGRFGPSPRLDCYFVGRTPCFFIVIG